MSCEGEMLGSVSDEWDLRYRPAPSSIEVREVLRKEHCTLVRKDLTVPATVSVRGARLRLMASDDTLNVTIVPTMRIKRLNSRGIAIQGIWEFPVIELRFAQSVTTDWVVNALLEASTQVLKSLFAPLVTRLVTSKDVASASKEQCRRYGLPLAAAHCLHMPPITHDAEPSYEMRFVVLIMASPEAKFCSWHSLRIYRDERCKDLLYTMSVNGKSVIRTHRTGYVVELRWQPSHQLIFASPDEGELWGNLLRDLASMDPRTTDERGERATAMRKKGRAAEEEGILARLGPAEARRQKNVLPLLEMAEAPPPWLYDDEDRSSYVAPKFSEGFDVAEVLKQSDSDSFVAALMDAAGVSCQVVMDD